MTIKIAATINDAELEAGIAQGLTADNAATGQNRSAEEFCAAAALAALEAFRGSAKADLVAKVQQLDYADLGAVAQAVDAAIATKAQPSPPIMVQP